MRRLLFLLLISFAEFSHANYYCVGKVAHFGIDERLNVSNGFGIHRLCSIVDEKCQAWASLVLAAKMADRQVIIYYADASISGDQSNGACTQIGTWVTPADIPYYLQLQ